MTHEDIPEEDLAERRDSATQKLEFGTLGIGLILFVMGLAVGFPLAMIGTSFLTDNAGLIVAIVLTIAIFVGLTGAIILLFRKKILSFLFNLSTSQLDQFSKPLSETARNIMDRKADAAVDSAEELTKLLLARWTWLATRRWLIGSLTGLIAALAALAGTTLLFRQNELLAIQLVRLDQQNELLATQIELGEAQRSAGILPGLLDIGDKLAQETETLKDDGRPAPFFQLTELSDGIRARIIAATQSTRPYRYLKTSAIDPNDIDSLNRLAMARRPEIIGDPKIVTELEALKNESALLDRPTSPERGVILSMLYGSGVLETELLSFYGADFAFAEVTIGTLNVMSFQFARLRFSSFRRIALNSIPFGGAELDHASFHGSVLTNCVFSGIASSDIKPPYSGDASVPVMRTNMAGTVFTDTVVMNTKFAHVNGLGMNFDGALLSEADFTGASIGGTTFVNAVLVAPVFSGAYLNSVDFDGAITFEEDFLDRIAAEAAPGSFVKDRFALEEISRNDVDQHPLAIQMFAVPEALVADKKIYRVNRVEPFG